MTEPTATTRVPNALRAGGFPLTRRSVRLYDAAAKGYPRSLELPRLASMVWGEEGVKQSSPNHEARAWTIELLRAAAWGSQREVAAALEVVYHWLDRELHQVGLWTVEQCCPAPHGGMHIEAAVNARLAARRLAHEQLTRLVDEHWLRLGSLLAAGATPGGTVLLPGERCPNVPMADQASAVWRHLMGLPETLRRLQGGVKEIDRYYYASLVGVQTLSALGDRFAGVTTALADRSALPLLRLQLVVERWAGGHRARITQRRQGDLRDLCDWVLADHAAVDAANPRHGPQGYRFGKAFAMPPPPAPTVARMVESPPHPPGPG
jgi:hypothetical protein